MKSPIYWHPKIYNYAMRILYGNNFFKKYELVAKEIGGLTVLDVCCGDCFLSKYINHDKYMGIDVNHTFISCGRRKGLNLTLIDVASDEWPSADCIVMLGSLYQFIPNHEKIMNKAFRKARRRVIISEPIVNLSQSKNNFVATIARCLTSPGVNSSSERFNRDSIMMLYKKYGASKFFDTGREVVGVFDINK